MTFDDILNNFQAYLLVFARVIGIFIFNPLFSRKNIPSLVKIGTSIALAFAVGATVVPTVHIEYDSVALLSLAIVKEGFVGVVLGFITQMFLSTILVSGEMMDMQSGLGMAKIYDAASGVQMSLYGSVMTYMFILYFFITNSHLTYIKIFATSFGIIPIGFTKINPDFAMVIVNYFGVVLTLALKLAVPLIVAQLLLEFCVGILMKTVPQIQVMQVNIQVKLLFGLFILFVIAAPLSGVIEKYIGILIDNLAGALPALVS